MKELVRPEFQVLGAVLFLSGNLFVFTSMWKLGITGTYLGNLSPFERGLMQRRLFRHTDGRNGDFVPFQYSQ